jgi:hypothetical protein
MVITACLKGYSCICVDIVRTTVDNVTMYGITTRTGTKGFKIKVYSVTCSFLETQWLLVAQSVRFMTNIYIKCYTLLSFPKSQPC